MCSVVAFFPGRRRLTNGMLDDLRAAGFYAGKGFALGWKPKKGFDAFAVETAAIREMVALRFKRAPFRGDDFGGLDVVVWVVGHGKADPDAWLLLGKAAVDGLVDAGTVRRDRDGVALAGRVSNGAVLGGVVTNVAGYALPVDDGRAGFYLLVAGRGCGCSRVTTLPGGS